MTGTDAGTVIAMEIFVEQQVIAPIGIILKLIAFAVDWSSASCVAQENARQAVRNLARNLE